MTGQSGSGWRPRWWVAATTVVTFFTGVGSFVYLVATGQGDPVLVIGCFAFVGLIPPLLALERFVQFRPGGPPGTPAGSSPPSSEGSSSSSQPPSSGS